jgi:hypothetical protein
MRIKRILIFSLIILANAALAQKNSGDSVSVPASLQYNDASWLGRLISGSNYRKEWSIPVAMPVFRIKEMGFTIKELGGGMQTKSLRLLDKNKREWVLRTVDKDAQGALPEKMRKRIVVNFVQDMISASHPYAPLVVDHLARVTHIIAPKPKVYFVPDDEGLGPYRKIFAGSVCYLEQREPTPDNSDTDNTEKVLEEIVEENDHLILQEAVLQARLLDMLIADWDRHADQWRWGRVDSGSVKYYYAIPRDRDQAFFATNGFLPQLIKIFALKHTNNFKKETKNLKNLNFKSWEFDKTFLNELDAGMWEKNIKLFQQQLPDDIIRAAVKNLPPEIYAIDGKSLEEKLISRRNTFLENGMKYYEFLSGNVTVFGTEEKELFTVIGDKKIIVTMYRGAKKQLSEKIYERTFVPDETGYIYLEGLGGDDEFLIDQAASSKIKIKIRGGKGRDVYDLRGQIKSKVYDSSRENNKIAATSNAKFIFN